MRQPRWKSLVEKSVAACCAAIEIYNKPVVLHRDETFSILVICAWELLLKARLLKESGNRMQAIYEMVPLTKKDGSKSKRMRVDLNRAKNPKTISLGTAIRQVSELEGKPLDALCRENLFLLMEVRDNAIHFMNEDRGVALRVHEVGIACLTNYVTALGDWFDYDLGGHRFAILPLSFDGLTSAKALKSPKRSQQTKNLLTHMDRTCNERAASEGARYAISLRVETRIVGSRSADASPIRLTSGPDAARVELTEEEFRARWPHDHKSMVALVKKRVPQLIVNNTFHGLVKERRTDQRFARDRRLDINNPKSSLKKTYFSEAMVDALVSALQKTSPARIG